MNTASFMAKIERKKKRDKGLDRGKIETKNQKKIAEIKL